VSPIDYAFVSAPRCSSAVFSTVLASRNSPATSLATELYAIPLSFGLDPAVALAFFDHESKYGTVGLAVETLNWGNIRRGQGREIRHKTFYYPNGKSRGQFAVYNSWANSLHDWCTLILNGYVRGGIGRGILDTVRRAIAVYAPADDENDPDGYANTVIALVTRWQNQSQPNNTWALWGSNYPLPIEQQAFAIPQRWFQSAILLGAATGPEIYLDAFTAVRPFQGGWITFEALTKTTHLQIRTKRLV
jgi:hypothetical protein